MTQRLNEKQLTVKNEDHLNGVAETGRVLRMIKLWKLLSRFRHQKANFNFPYLPLSGNTGG